MRIVVYILFYIYIIIPKIFQENVGLKDLNVSWNGMGDEGARDLFLDREGLLWVSCARGVSKKRVPKIGLIGTPRDLIRL